ncbi:ABC-type transport auxiliary lipoprotein component [Bartonella choladocola]|uniref:ABC-type transport auxiliary lipoprotein family protein n=1 Tax=Bartonella TaxID=773 RepID=UPI001FF0083D|nr:ABC-type transport auxiliary lipoprotein family protein [Bartonella choladocola]
MITERKKVSRFLSVSLGIMFTASVLSGCGTPSRDTYDLSIGNATLEGAQKHPKIQILVEQPDAVKALDGQDIVVKQGGSISYLKRAQWSDRLPDLVQARLIQAYDNSNHFGGVGRPGDGLAINYRILSDIRSFDVNVMNGHNVATLEIAVKIMDDRNGNIKAQKVFTANSPVSGTNNNQYAAALDNAFKKITNDIVNWTVSSI